MTIRQNSLEREAQITQALRWWKQTHGQSGEADTTQNSRKPTAFPTYRIILDEDVDAATDPLEPPTGSLDIAAPNATICEWSETDGKFKQTKRRLAVGNLNDEDYAEDDAAWAEPHAGHYYLAGCPFPVNDRPTPPWEESE